MAKRVPHFLTPKTKEGRPHHAILFDTETQAVPLPGGAKRLELKLAWACYWHRPNDSRDALLEWCFFTTPQSFWPFLASHLSHEHPLYLIAHNIAFDWRIVEGFDHAEREHWFIEFLYHKGMTTLLNYQTGTGELRLLDMGNFFSVPLSDIGRVVGIEKTEVNFSSCSFQELSDYCRNDARILVKAWEAWLDFLDDHELGDFRPTLAAQAMSAYRHSALQHPIKIHNDHEVCKLEREAYRGGRVECFSVGKLPEQPYYHLDVNGMYCYMMQQHEYPRLLRSWPQTLTPQQLEASLGKYCVIARALLHTDLPAFVFQADGYNIYPVGVFQAVLTTPELRFAFDHCQILKVGRVAIYEKAPIFEAYATYFADLKNHYEQEGNKPFQEIAKRLANSLYGKFGQSNIETDLSFSMPPLAPREAPYYDWRSRAWCRIYKLGQQVVFEKSEGESFNSFPAIPAHVTAHARLYLYSLIRQAGIENVFYCATDSLIVNQAGYDNLADKIDAQRLGYLKVETESNDVEIWGPNQLRVGDTLKSGGIRKNAIQIGRNTFEQDLFLGLRGAIRIGNPDLVTVSRAKKRVYRRIKTGQILDSGRVRPFRLSL